MMVWRNAGRTSRRASAARMVRCSEPPPAGAAMRNTRVAGPSGAPKSTPAGTRASPRLGTVTCSDRACGRPIAAGHAGGHLRLAGRDVGQEAVQVGDPAGRLQLLGELPGGVRLVLGDQVENDQLFGDEVCHDATSFTAWRGSGSATTRTASPQVDVSSGPGTVRTRQQAGGAAPGDRAGKPLGGRADRVQVAGEGAVAGADGAPRDQRRAAGPPRPLGGDQQGAVPAQADQQVLAAALRAARAAASTTSPTVTRSRPRTSSSSSRFGLTTVAPRVDGRGQRRAGGVDGDRNADRDRELARPGRRSRPARPAGRLPAATSQPPPDRCASDLLVHRREQRVDVRRR